MSSNFLILGRIHLPALDQMFGPQILPGRLAAPGVVIGQTATRGDQTPDNYVFFQTAQLVPLAHDGRLGQYPCGFLEGSRGDERVGRQGSLGDTEQDRVIGGGLLVGRRHVVVDLQHFRALDLFAGDEAGGARIHHHDTAQHLAHDDFDMLVVDLHTLQPVDVLHLVGDVARQRLDPLQAQDVVRIDRAIDDHLALLDDLTVVGGHVLFLGDQVLVRNPVEVGDDQALLALCVLAERDGAGDFRQHAGVLRRARLEQFGHARQTAGNVASLRGFLRNTRQHITHRYILAILHGNDRADLEGDVDDRIGACDPDLIAGLVQQLDLRAQALAGSTLAFGVDHHQRGQASDIVKLLGDGNALFDVLEADPSCVFGNDGTGVRIPGRQHRTVLDLRTVGHHQGGAVRHLVAFALSTAVIRDDDFTTTRNRHQFLARIGHVAHGRGVLNRAVGLGLELAGRRRTRSGAADMEGPHGELGARLADRLRGDHADRFAHVDQISATQVSAVALATQAVARFTGQRRAHLDFVDAERLDDVDHVFHQQGAGLEHGFLAFGMNDIAGSHASENPFAQGFNHFTALDQRLDHQAVLGAAIILDHNQILRDVDQTARQIARVRGLQRGVGEALAGAVRRDEVLQHVQAFTEVRRDRGFDDGAVRLRHQAAHAGQLANLRSGAARA